MPYSFNLPVLTDLTTAQQMVLNETASVAVSGGPGTGKSVIMLWRHIRNYSLSQCKSLLLTYTKSLEYYLKYAAMGVEEAAAHRVDRMYMWTEYRANSSYDEVIVDEAQDVELARYEIIKRHVANVSYSADNQQSLYPDKETRWEVLERLFVDNKHFHLDENFRNTYEITYFIQSIFPDKLIPEGKKSSEMSAPKPIVIRTNANDEVQKKAMEEVIDLFQSDTHNIVVLVPLENEVSHISGNQTVDFWYNLLINDGYDCSKYTHKKGEIGVIKNIHVTTFKSVKGLEFDTVIIPNFDLFQINLDGLNTVTENDYYVALTRTRRNLYLIDDSMVEDNERCSLPFLHNAVTNHLLEVNDEYLKLPGFSEDEPDDLPF